jgi:hypothetical protein
MFCSAIRTGYSQISINFQISLTYGGPLHNVIQKNDRETIPMMDCRSNPDSHPPEQACASPAPRSKPHAKFTASEDAHLRSLLRLYGPTNWALIAERISGKTARQCRERWMNYLAPELNTRPWTAAEDALLKEKYRLYGSRWVAIAKFFTNRTDGMVKNRFLMLQRKERKAQRRCAPPPYFAPIMVSCQPITSPPFPALT